MQCPFCADDGNRVIDSRLARDGSEIRRRRECDECSRRFTTRERIEETLPRIIKHDERREEYDRKKLLRGVEHACVKRPVSTEAVERLVDDLSEIDALAAVRFASVFRNFSSPSDYEAFFAEIEAHADAVKAVKAAEASRDEAGQDDPNDKVRPLRARG